MIPHVPILMFATIAPAYEFNRRGYVALRRAMFEAADELFNKHNSVRNVKF